MHLVFVTSIVPDGTPATGYEIANAAILDALGRAGVRVSVLGFTWPDRTPADPQNTSVLGAVDVNTETAGAWRRLGWLSRALWHRTTFASAKLKVVGPDEVRAALEAIGPADGYVLNSVQFAGAFEEVFADRPSIYVAHNVEHRSAEENAAAASGIVERLLYRREARHLKRLEARLCARARYVFTLAEEDRRLLGVDRDSRSAALPLVTTPTRSRTDGARQPRCDAALIGTWTWTPNRIGLEWFLARVVPLLDPDFTVEIAGRVPAGLAEAYPRVRFAGRVEDAAGFVRSGRVVPLVSRAGTGVQLKTIEVFEQGLPSVATSRSVRGIARIPANCAVTDDPHEFARALEASAAAPRDVDGRSFRRAQRHALDEAVRHGLAQFGFAVREEAA